MAFGVEFSDGVSLVVFVGGGMMSDCLHDGGLLGGW